MRFSAVGTWIRALSLFFRHILEIGPFALLFLVPFVSDLFSTALVAQERQNGQLRPGLALQQILPALPAFARLKLYYYVRALGWGLIPIYGLIRGIDERLAGAMSSNVILLEPPTSFSEGAARCEDLVSEFRGESSAVLIRVPLLLLFGVAVLLALGHSPWAFWTAIGMFIWLLLPGSAAANTYLYFWIREQEGGTESGDVCRAAEP